MPSPRFLNRGDDFVVWVATHVPRIRGPIPVEFTGSGDTLLNWVLTGASTLTYRRLSPQLLVLEGTIDGRVVRLELTQRDLNSFVLTSRGFNWVQNVPFNR